jgi:hypothetical protein
LGLLSVLVIFMSLRLASFPKAAAVAPPMVVDTMHTHLGNSNLKEAQFPMDSSRHLLGDTVSMMRSSFSSPIAEAIDSQTQAHDSRPTTPASAKLADAAPGESPLRTEEEGAAALSLSSGPKQVDEPVDTQEATASSN